MIFLILYFLDGLLNLIAEYLQSSAFVYSTKILLMPLLIVYLWQTKRNKKNIHYIFAALFFSWLGDIFLMLPRNNYSQDVKQLLFISGLIAFLMAHVSYIIYFIKETYT